jgi:hypothetical protein
MDARGEETFDYLRVPAFLLSVLSEVFRMQVAPLPDVTSFI